MLPLWQLPIGRVTFVKTGLPIGNNVQHEEFLFCTHWAFERKHTDLAIIDNIIHKQTNCIARILHQITQTTRKHQPSMWQMFYRSWWKPNACYWPLHICQALAHIHHTYMCKSRFTSLKVLVKLYLMINASHREIAMAFNSIWIIKEIYL